QDITVTVPASFDEAAQRLTLAAAREAGYPESVRLLEEPQAAFLYWLEKEGRSKSLLAGLAANEPPYTVLVCDIGGGTSDFSLFEVTPRPEAEPVIERIAVSDHILLGGDNIDLALAHALEQRMLGADELSGLSRRLSPRQFRHLLSAARALKERILGNEEEISSGEECRVSVPAEGSSLFGGSLTALIKRDEVCAMVTDGFFPFCPAEAKPHSRSAALREWGLPYAADSRISVHLAAFLAGRRVDAVLYNGGTLAPHFIRRRLQEIIAGWQSAQEPLMLELDNLQLSVARGAALYGVHARRAGLRIVAGYARSVYLEVRGDEDEREEEENFGPARGICILEQGQRSTEVVRLKNKLQLLIGEPVRFQVYCSTHRERDKAGDIVHLNDEEFHALPPLQAALTPQEGMERPKDGLVDVELEAALNELGLVQVFCVHRAADGSEKRWQLEFNLRRTVAESVLEGVRDNSGELLETGVSPEQLAAAALRIGFFFGKKQQLDKRSSPKKLLRELEELFKQPRNDWNAALLRSLWPALSRGITRRGRSLAHETTWLYFAGFVLRPGYGVQLDEWRMGQVWRCFDLGLSFPKESSALAQWWIMWRRIAGGLNKERQEKLLDKILPRMSQKGADEPEMLRLAGALERIEVSEKIALGNLLVKKILGGKSTGVEHCIWALGRTASRTPLYGGLHQVVPAAQVVSWFEQLSGVDWTKGNFALLNGAFVQACRLTNDRHRDLSPEALRLVLQKMAQSGAGAERMRPLREFVELEAADQVELLGDSLPIGLRFA
ncbi:MAG TPA: Hsp70 family protein, partial [Oligoflexia bacterium]|nr:Hsp70 family protein [Oligoflexia bacterium]